MRTILAQVLVFMDSIVLVSDLNEIQQIVTERELELQRKGMSPKAE